MNFTKNSYWNQFFICFSLCFLNLCSASEFCEYPDYLHEERIDILPSELLITDTGLYLLKFGEAHPLTAVFSDESGLYTIIETKRKDKDGETCPKGHKIIHDECMGCGRWWCPYRCFCHFPWFPKGNSCRS